MSEVQWTPVTFETCGAVSGPFYHGTKVLLGVGDLLSPGRPSNYDGGRVLRHIYFSASLEPAIWGAELAVALSHMDGRGHIYIVEPTGAFEDDPNLTNKRFPGNPTKSFRTREPLRITGLVHDWQSHTKEELGKMLDGLQNLRRQGLFTIED
jgi:rifampin ADP-ribosylating transferase